jgi:tRNA-dihydrouridine synthase
VLRNPWILAQAEDLLAGREPRTVTLQERGRFLLEYIDLLLNERVREAEGFRRTAPAADASQSERPPRHERWVINKIRALAGYYTKGVENGAELRAGINTTATLASLRDLIARFFELA